MHDLDRTLNELEWEAGAGFDAGEGSFGDSEFELEFEDAFGAGELGEELGGDDGLMSEMEEVELASELLNASSDAEIDQFLGKVFRRIRRRIGRAIPSLRPLAGMLRGLVRRALPIAGGALGTFGGPLGTALGSRLGGAASRLFEAELEGMSPEDQEFEVARRLVRLASSAAQQAAGLPTGPPLAAARAALAAAARTHAPGLLQRGPGASVAAVGGRSGRWVRRGRRIVLLGV